MLPGICRLYLNPQKYELHNRNQCPSEMPVSIFKKSWNLWQYSLKNDFAYIVVQNRWCKISWNQKMSWRLTRMASLNKRNAPFLETPCNTWWNTRSKHSNTSHFPFYAQVTMNAMVALHWLIMVVFVMGLLTVMTGRTRQTVQVIIVILSIIGDKVEHKNQYIIIQRSGAS